MTPQKNVKYRLDIEKIISYCSSSEEKITQSDISELFQPKGNNGFDMVQRQVNTSTIKNGQLKTLDTYKYDMVKGLIHVLFGMGFNANGMVEQRDFTVGESIVWNTLIIYEFLIEVD